MKHKSKSPNTVRERQGLFIQEDRGAQLRTIKGTDKNIQVKTKRQQKWPENWNRK